MNSKIVWFALGLLVIYFLSTEYIGKNRYKECKNAFVLTSKNNWTGIKLTKEYFASKNIDIKIEKIEGAFNDIFNYRKNTLYISNTGNNSNVVAAVNATGREAIRAVLYNENKTLYFTAYLIQDILKTLTLFALPGFVVGLIIKNDYVVLTSIITFFVLGIYNSILSTIDRKISSTLLKFVEDKEMFKINALNEFKKINDIADTSLFYSTFNSLRQIETIINILVNGKTK